MDSTLPSPQSLWTSDTEVPDRLGQLPAETGVVVVGAGIAGLTTACLLARSGVTVTVLVAHQVGGGVTGNTTAKISAQHGITYDRLRRTLGLDKATGYARAQTAALDWIAQEVREHRVDCGFERRDSYVHTARSDRLGELGAEAEAAQAAGLPAELVTDLDLPVPVAAAVRFRDQAQFHPLRWLLHLAAQVEAHGGSILEGVRVLNARPRDEVVRVTTDRGEVRARHVVIATHYPILDRSLFFARLDPTRDLVVHGPVPEDTIPPGMYLSADDGHSLRTPPGAPASGGSLIVGGEHHRPGSRVDVEARFGKLARWARDTVGMTGVEHRWSAHDLTAPDTVPYIGRYTPTSSNLWVATGFRLWGMTNGTAAGHLLHDLVRGEADPGQTALFDPHRISPKMAPGVALDNLKVARHLVEGSARAVFETGDAEDLKPGEARVSQEGLRTVAAYRSPDGVLHRVSGRCTHLGCVVAFNNAEKSWDCPCHASRFDVDGTVLNGPATTPLPRLDP